MSKVKTLGQFIIEKQNDFPFAKGEFSRLLRDIGIAAKIVPSINAPIAENTVSWIVVQNAFKIWPRYLLKICTFSALPADALVSSDGGVGAAIPAASRFFSNADFQLPSCSILTIASLIFWRRS